ncbi:uncharacterized protein N7483_003746 [Penicillium malachiteum]|uniref:uncharacterized protein n=1 Tax=Penicillium malachiteum TaxID=1324776 RepID=UPI00254748AC|nr:uncharacterized protein N7483_003746 [Penicillium malachiteum]KAJ5729238.1 hypothetical protein N7483_003746 [Penicillium malachiteum]
MTPHVSQTAVHGEGSSEPSRDNERALYIAVMGMTGAGKSTFISHCTDTKVAISDPGALQSCTQEVQVYLCKNLESHINVYLVDTPGFDDTNRKDTDILKDIAAWLTKTYKESIRLGGILYLHRISDNRIGGCAYRNLIMFKKLCGPDGIKNVIFLSTFWEKVDPTEGDAREKALEDKDEFWGYFVKQGARVQRHLNTEDSAMAAIKNFIPIDATNEPPNEIKLAIQTEMVDSGKDLDQTSAGQELQSELQKERDKMQQELNNTAREIREEKDQEIRDLLQKDQDRQAKELQKRDLEIQELKISMERIHEWKIQELEEQILKQQSEFAKHREEMSEEMNRMMEQRRSQHRDMIEDQRDQNVDKLKRQLRELYNQIEHQQMQLDQFNHDMSEAGEYDSEEEYDSSDNEPDDEPDNDALSCKCEVGSLNGNVASPASHHNEENYDEIDSPITEKPDTSFKPFEHFEDSDGEQEFGPVCQVCWQDFEDRDELLEHVGRSRHGFIVNGNPVFVPKRKRSKWYKPNFISRLRQ